ncbi:MAG: metallophosphoesterase [Solirubrobacteraceae bacterium]
MSSILIVSDLHVGDRGRSDVLRREGIAGTLLDAVERVDSVVLLGDAIELRNRPARDALAASEPFYRALGEALAGKPLVIVAGNHDHTLVERFLARHDEPLGLEQRFTPKKASDLAAALAEQLGSGADVEFAYPGVWLREDVYAMHGHYLDVHMTVPTFERLAIALSGRLALDRSRPWNAVACPDDYEALLAPVYAWNFAAAQSGRTGQGPAGGAANRMWRTLRAGRSGGLRAQSLASAFPLAVRALNAAGFGPLSAELTPAELRRAGLLAMSEVVERLRIRARHVIFGHTHRAGMLEGDSLPEWLTPNGVQLHNVGSWVFSETLVSGGDSESPYWPGGAVLIENGGPPQLLRLLASRPAAQLSALRAR